MANREIQLNNLVKKELGEIIFKNIDFPKGSLVTIIKVTKSKDKKRLEIYINILPNRFVGKILKILNNRSRYLKFLLNKRLSANFPEISFFLNNHDNIDYEFF